MKTDAYSVLGLTRPSIGTLWGEGHNNKQCTVQWDAYWQAEAWISNQTPRTTVERCCVVARQCPSSYYCPHWGNAPKTQVWSNGSSSVYLWSCPVWLPLVCSTQRGIKGSSIHLGPRNEGSGACVARCSAETFFSEGIRKLVQRWTKCVEKQGDYVEKWCWCKFPICIAINV